MKLAVKEQAVVDVLIGQVIQHYVENLHHGLSSFDEHLELYFVVIDFEARGE